MVIPDNYPPEIINHLPESVNKLAAIAGLNNAIALVNNFGGTRLSFGTKSKHAVLASIVGAEALQAYCYHFGSELIAIPSCKLAQVWLKNRLIFDDIRRGRSHAEIAIKHGCSEQWILKLRKRYRAEQVNPL